MKRFLARIRAKALDNRLPPVTLVALGDSVTQGVMEHKRLEPQSTYHRQLQEELEAFFPTTTFNLINAGIAGDNAPGGLARLERDVLAFQPDLVIIGFGLNDSVSGEAGEAAFAEALGAMVRRISSETDAAIILLTPPFMATRPSPKIHPDHQEAAKVILEAQCGGSLARYAAIVRAVGQAHGISVADVHAEWQRLSQTGLDTDLWLTNGLNHPGFHGHQLAKTLVFQIILKAHLELQ